MKRFIDLTGQRFFRWKVIRVDYGNHPTRGAYFLCLCDCGTESVVSGNSLRQGKSRSCGCLQVESITSHGESGPIVSREYRIWNGMKGRCTNPMNRAFARYGGRGIKVCERWLSYDNFLADMGRCPNGKTLDRKNNKGNYEPGNCRWATPRQQANNRDNNRLLTWRGRIETTANWARILSVPRRLLEVRLTRGWTVERTLETPRGAYAA